MGILTTGGLLGSLRHLGRRWWLQNATNWETKAPSSQVSSAASRAQEQPLRAALWDPNWASIQRSKKPQIEEMGRGDIGAANTRSSRGPGPPHPVPPSPELHKGVSVPGSPELASGQSAFPHPPLLPGLAATLGHSALAGDNDHTVGSHTFTTAE